MTILDIFERVQPLEQRKFFNYLNDTQDELKALYGETRILSYTETAPEKYDTFADLPATGEAELRYLLLDTGLIYKWVTDEYISMIQLCTALADTIAIDPLYHPAIVDNIKFFAGAGDAFKGEFLRKSKEAYLRLWNINARGKQVKRARW